MYTPLAFRQSTRGEGGTPRGDPGIQSVAVGDHLGGSR